MCVNYPVFFVKCDICKHRTEGETCKAFPDGIPEDFTSGTYPHRGKHPSQKNDIVFELGKLNENASEELKDFYELYKDIGTSRHEKKKKRDQKSLEPIGIKE
jgi:hypothetical protein